MAYWLMKSEPEVYGIDDLRNEPSRIGHWDGDEALFYHSGGHPGVAGIMRLHGAAYPDPTALDPQHDAYDPKSDPAAPRWYAIDVRYQRKLRRFISLAELRAEPKLKDLLILRRGNRLSITPISAAEWQAILRLEKRTD
jgi:predicted RNA-binding protein with PUA-like domain